MLQHWTLTFLGNLAGALFIVGVVMGHGGVFSADAYKKEILTIATAKAVTPMWHQIFLKAIGANWLVCLACFLSCCAREFFSKVTAIWWPVFAFVLLGLDHVIANMVSLFFRGGFEGLVGAGWCCSARVDVTRPTHGSDESLGPPLIDQLGCS